MTERSKKINFPQTSPIPDERTRVYARKLTRVLEDMLGWLNQEVNYIYEQGVTDHGELEGLQDVEDHLYAFLKDGSRAFSGHGPGFSNDTNLASADPYSAVSEYAIKAYVDALLAYILASPLGTVIYIWEDHDGTRKLERLTPGEYGQVLTTAGPNHPPFWAWVYEEPGADFGGRIWFTIWMYAYVKEVAIITIDVEKIISTSGGMTITERDNFNEPSRFTNSTDYGNSYHPEMTASVQNASIITMDDTKQLTISMDILAPLFVQVSDSISVADSAAVTIPLNINVSDSVNVTDSTGVNIV